MMEVPGCLHKFNSEQPFKHREYNLDLNRDQSAFHIMEDLIRSHADFWLHVFLKVHIKKLNCSSWEINRGDVGRTVIGIYSIFRSSCINVLSDNLFRIYDIYCIEFTQRIIEISWCFRSEWPSWSHFGLVTVDIGTA